jgi:murein DD-endopeptidase MepM/ murein hydrolase activator NlpD
VHKAIVWFWSLVVAAGLGFYFGHSNASKKSAEAVSPEEPLETVQTRAREKERPQVPAYRQQKFEERTARLRLPIDGLTAKDIQDSFDDKRGSDRIHEATDILAPRGTAVRAVLSGTIKKLFISKAGGNTIYQFDAEERYCYYYAHLDRYAPGIEEGQFVEQGRVIGYVGTTGNANPNTPHLHFAVFELGPEKHWWEGKPINPYPLLKEALQR